LSLHPYRGYIGLDTPTLRTTCHCADNQYYNCITW